MNKAEMIGKLEVLLGRVRSRSVRGKPASGAALVAPPAVEPSLVAVQPAHLQAPLPAAFQGSSPAQSILLPSPPPPPPAEEAPEVMQEAASGKADGEDVAVVWGETTLLESDTDLEQALEGHDSRERLVAAEPSPFESSPPEPSAPEPASLESSLGEVRLSDSVPIESVPADSIPIESVGREFVPDEPAMVVQRSEPPMDVTELDLEAPEPEEEAPISSRRVVASQPEEQLAQLAFGAEEPPVPLHTPPPESGRLPSAPASEFDQESDAAESRRLRAATVGDFDGDPDVTGVRNATPLLPLRHLQSSAREFVPEITRAAREPSDAVAQVISAAQRFSPSTFVALLDASLSL